ncbi:hypothetical protein GCM10010109_41600 [Actinoplanes campanulatus]|nr:hypothetical protein GCM10010109_41600 [Actinoplanes campanulatus]GID39429.1 hypothetical protein Aca09nite_59350 [Actinoplanes campanulatus]
MIVEDRRKARVGTVSGLALLTGATAFISIAGGHHSLFATLLLGLLAAMMAHALVVEVQRQARRRSQVLWYWTDTVNAVLLAIWALTAVAASCAPFTSLPVRILGGLLAVGYTATCIYFVLERRRAVTAPFLPVPAPSAEPEDAPVADSTPTV